jgi:hypothetical protein
MVDQEVPLTRGLIQSRSWPVTRRACHARTVSGVMAASATGSNVGSLSVAGWSLNLLYIVKEVCTGTLLPL